MNHSQSFLFFLFNGIWMGWNIFLAIVPIVLARLLHKAKLRYVQGILLFVWLIFLPNTLYMITDVIHIFNPRFSQMTLLFWILGIGLYVIVFVLAVYTFVLAIQPVLQKFQKFLGSLNYYARTILFTFFSILVGFAISMGRFQRTNTWYIFTQPLRVVKDAIESLTDPTVLLLALFYSFGAFILILFTARNIDNHLSP